MNVKLLEVEVSAVHLDSETARLLAAERIALLQADAATVSPRHKRGTRIRVGRWLVGLGVRLAGPSAAEGRTLTASR